jgi:hypothetical protein
MEPAAAVHVKSLERAVRHRDSRPHEQRFYRLAVGGSNLALAAMLFYGASRYFDLIAPRFGHRFVYVPVLMCGIAVWVLTKGLLILLRRGRGNH